MASTAGAYESVVSSWQETGSTDDVYQPASDAHASEPQADSWLSNCAWDDRKQTSNSWYLGVFGGWNFVPPLVTDFGFFPGTIFLNDGGLIGLSLGREVNDYYRAEAEVVYRRNTVEDLSPSIGQEFSGHVNNLAVMGNVYRDFGTARLRPYLGGGLGVSYVDVLVYQTFAPSYPTVVGYDTMFAFQGMAGLTYEVTRRISLYSEYRYFGTTGIGLDYGTNIPTVADATYNAHSVIMGLQLRR